MENINFKVIARARFDRLYGHNIVCRQFDGLHYMRYMLFEILFGIKEFKNG